MPNSPWKKSVRCVGLFRQLADEGIEWTSAAGVHLAAQTRVRRPQSSQTGTTGETRCLSQPLRL